MQYVCEKDRDREKIVSIGGWVNSILLSLSPLNRQGLVHYISAKIHIQLPSKRSQSMTLYKDIFGIDFAIITGFVFFFANAQKKK